MKYIILVCIILITLTYYLSQKESNNPENSNNLKKKDSVKLNIDNNKNVHEFDASSYKYGDVYWEVKPSGFSDIFNYTDNGGEEINKIVDIFTERDITDYIIGSKLEKNMEYKNNSYSLLGLAENKSYRQYYFIYESKVSSSRTNTLISEELEYNTYQVYEYILVKYDGNTPKVVHYVGPREKININDIVYLSLGTFELGPLVIKSIHE